MTTEERLEKLERELTGAKWQNRRLKIGLILCLGMFFVWAFFVQSGRLCTAQGSSPTIAPTQQQVRARSFVLEDDMGRTRAALLVMDEQGPLLSLCDESGRFSARLFVDKNGPGLALYGETRGENPKPCAHLHVDKNGPVLSLNDDDGKTLIELDVNVNKNSPRMRLFDKCGRPRSSLSVIEEGVGLTLIDENGKARTSLVLGKGGPELAVFDENGSDRASLGVDKDGPMLRLRDKNSNTQTVLGALDDESGLIVFDKNGKLRASLAVVKNVSGLTVIDENGKPRATLGVKKDGPELRLYGPNSNTLWKAP